MAWNRRTEEDDDDRRRRGVRQYESAGNEQICIGKGALGRSFTCDWEGTGKVLVVEACQEWETGKAVRQELGGGEPLPW